MKRISLLLPLCQLHDVDLTVYFPQPIHPQLNGNKPFKLKYNMDAMRANSKKGVLTFGGAYSNHLAATAAAGKIYGFETIGVVRGERSSTPSDVILFCEKQGMQLIFISRTEYAKRYELGWMMNWQKKFPSYFIVPEGGANELGIKGCEELLAEDCKEFDVLACAVGTGTTLAGIACAAGVHQHVRGYAVLDDLPTLEKNIGAWCRGENWSLSAAGVCGGYAKTHNELEQLIAEMRDNFNLQLDSVYTGKLVFGLLKEIESGLWNGKKILAIHTGGFRLSP
ncbi:MAG: 1-aminocyclopropane-1-carboxylate deaminase/D-cysteine desulfhydrase [Bacteroidia bacterium]